MFPRLTLFDTCKRLHGIPFGPVVTLRTLLPLDSGCRDLVLMSMWRGPTLASRGVKPIQEPQVTVVVRLRSRRSCGEVGEL
jgi:hypothetical protein